MFTVVKSFGGAFIAKDKVILNDTRKGTPLEYSLVSATTLVQKLNER